MGTTRFRTLRVHCLNLELLIHLGLKLPWDEPSVRLILNKAEELELTSSRLNQMWNTLVWVSKRFGSLNPDSIERLTRKKESVLNTLVKVIMAPQKQAAVPSVQVLHAMEHGLLDDQLPMANRYILGVARFMAGSSARFNDIQHCRPQDYRLTFNSIEVMAWQTKTSGAQGRYRRSCILIAPQWSFTGHKWWETLITLFQRISNHEKLKIMDYTPNNQPELQGSDPKTVLI